MLASCGAPAVKVPVVQVVAMSIVHDGSVPAVCAVSMRMVLVDVLGHGNPPRCWCASVGVVLVQRGLLGRMLERVRDELDDVAVGERVVDVLARSAPLHDVLGAQKTQLL